METATTATTATATHERGMLGRCKHCGRLVDSTESGWVAKVGNSTKDIATTCDYR